ncbi:MAG TPA: hypothetical protein VK157_04310 [Phycisphaerales bacterium]|nr:hypothetical protein [Phycisphaerales bacterium]
MGWALHLSAIACTLGKSGENQKQAAFKALQVHDAYRERNSIGVQSASAAVIAAAALSAATADRKGPRESARHAASAARNSRYVMVANSFGTTTAPRSDYGDFVDAVESDIMLLRRRAEVEGWTDSTPVNPLDLGRLWPRDEPAWARYVSPKQTFDFPRSEPRPRGTGKLVLKLTVPPMEDTPENRAAFRARVKELLLAANGLHIAHGGSGLRIGDVKMWARQPAMVPVPSGGGDA